MTDSVMAAIASLWGFAGLLGLLRGGADALPPASEEEEWRQQQW